MFINVKPELKNVNPLVIPNICYTFASSIRKNDKTEIDKLKYKSIKSNRHNMNDNNIYSDEIIKRQAAILLEMKEGVGIHGFIGDESEYTEFRNGLTEILRKKNYIRPSYKVLSMWFNDGKICSFDTQKINNAYFNISSCDGYYNEVSITSGNYRVLPKNCNKVNEETLSLILDECEKLINCLKQMKEDAKKSPEISELMETLLSYAQKHVDKDMYTVKWEKGKLNMENSDTEPYNCLVVRYKENNEYHSSIVFSKNEIGKYYATQRTPLCGQGTINFTLDTAEEQIKKIINF